MRIKEASNLHGERRTSGDDFSVGYPLKRRTKRRKRVDAKV